MHLVEVCFSRFFTSVGNSVGATQFSAKNLIKRFYSQFVNSFIFCVPCESHKHVTNKLPSLLSCLENLISLGNSFERES